MIDWRCNRFKILGFFIVLMMVHPCRGFTQIAEQLRISGYTEALPIHMNFELPQPFGEQNYFEFRLQNRLNLQWFAGEHFNFNWEMRTRLFTGDLVNDFPGYAESIDTDNGLVNLSWLISDEENWFLHYIPDRLYGEWVNNDWSIRVGRQRINWGINMVTNPNDLFNIYSFYDFAYPERPGADAIRVQHFLDFASRIEIAVSPARELKETVAAMLWSFNRSEYDFQFIGGYYRNRAALGGGWAGSLNQTGFKGEFTVFYDIEQNNNSRDLSFVTAISADHMFDNSLFVIAELLYNSAGGQNQFSVLGEPLSADNPSFSTYQVLVQLNYPISPIMNGSVAGIWYPDEEGLFITPALTRSLAENLDLQLTGQFFTGSDTSPFSGGGRILAGSLKWSF
jgi:hypothetical protein